MSKLFYSTLLLCATIVFFSCEDDPEPEVTGFEYHAHIHQPNTDDKYINDTMHIHIELESHTAMTVHHANIRIYNKMTNEEVYNKPDEAHVHETDGKFEYHDNFVLSNLNGVEADSDWIIEAKVWGHEAGLEEVIESVEFHINPE